MHISYMDHTWILHRSCIDHTPVLHRSYIGHAYIRHISYACGWASLCEHKVTRINHNTVTRKWPSRWPASRPAKTPRDNASHTMHMPCIDHASDTHESWANHTYTMRIWCMYHAPIMGVPCMRHAYRASSTHASYIDHTSIIHISCIHHTSIMPIAYRYHT